MIINFPFSDFSSSHLLVIVFLRWACCALEKVLVLIRERMLHHGKEEVW